jgi:hypothetical protein
MPKIGRRKKWRVLALRPPLWPTQGPKIEEKEKMEGFGHWRLFGHPQGPPFFKKKKVFNIFIF